MNIGSNAFTPAIDGPGLQIVVTGGTILSGNISTTLPTQTVALTANATNFVYLKILQIGDISTGNPAQLTPTIAVTTNSAVGPDGIPICVAVTGPDRILSLQDVRPDLIL